MTFSRFEDLPVWQEAIRLANAIYACTSQPSFRPPASFRSQLERAALSVSNNIAEGFERGTTSELLNFLYIARGSAGEVRSMLALAEPHREWGTEAADIARCKSLAESCAKQLRAWADQLQNSEIKGQRYLNKKTATRYQTARNAEAIRKKWLNMLPFDHPLRKAERDREQDTPNPLPVR